MTSLSRILPRPLSLPLLPSVFLPDLELNLSLHSWSEHKMMKYSIRRFVKYLSLKKHTADLDIKYKPVVGSKDKGVWEANVFILLLSR